jgi:hypothetical protein
VEDSGGRIRLHPLPSWSPESNPMELVWWSMHEAVSRNHECSGLDDLVEFAEGFTSGSNSPFGSNSARSTSSWKGRRPEIGECSFISWTYLAWGAGKCNNQHSRIAVRLLPVVRRSKTTD